MESKAKEFIDLIVNRYKLVAEAGINFLANELYFAIKGMPDTDWREIMNTIETNRKRDKNIGMFEVPKYTRIQRLNLMDFIWDNDVCGLHNSYWSRMWWMAKGGPLIKVFPVNAILIEFEEGKRTDASNRRLYKNR